MDNSQTSVTEDKDKPDKDGDRTERDSGGYYYDDETGYEIYRDDDEDADEEEGNTPEVETN